MHELTREQLRLSLTFMAAVCFTSLGIVLLAHFSPVIPHYIAQELARQRQINGIYYYDAGYADAEDYVLIGQVPQDDYSRGGVYFFGASGTTISIMPWELPLAERTLIHNYALGDLSHRELRYFLRSLIEEHDLLQAGGRKTTVMLCLFYGMARRKSGANHFVARLFPRHGFYSYDPEDGIYRVPMSSLERFLRRERVYANRFLQILTVPYSDVIASEKPNPAKYQAMWIKSIGPNWQGEMAAQVDDLAALLDYLQERKVPVRVIFPPRGTWHDGLPFDAAYRNMLQPILESRKIPVTDLSRLLPDEDFGDAGHLRYSGQWKLHRVYRELALRALEEMGTELHPSRLRLASP
jgi:hypothetical protein